MKAIFLAAAGFVLLGLGAVGLVLPVWPTTPFVLAAAACFTATPRVRAQIMRINFFREHIENYERRTGLSKKTVLISLGYLWGMLLISMLVLGVSWISGGLLLIGAAVTVHIAIMAKAGKEAKK